MRRFVGSILLFFGIFFTLVFLFYPFLAGYDQYWSFLIRKVLYFSRVMFGEEGTVVFLISIIIFSLPLVLKKSLYNFFKNFLGVELGFIGWCGIYGISNLLQQPYILGIFVYDISHFLYNLFGPFSIVLSWVLLILGLFLISFSYKFTRSVIGLVFSSIFSVLLSLDFSKLKEYFDSEGKDYSHSSFGDSSGVRDFDKVSNKSSVGSGSYNEKFYNKDKEGKFIDITVIDDFDEGKGGIVESKGGDVKLKRYVDKEDFYHDGVEINTKEKVVKLGTDELFDEEEDNLYYSNSSYSKEYEQEAKKEDFNVVDTVILDESNDYVEEKVFSGKYPPPIDLLDIPEFSFDGEVNDYKEIEETKKIIHDTFAEFKVDATIEGVVRGPVVTMYEVRPQPGTKIAKIVNLSDNLALNLATSRVRIVYPIPGKSVIGIEIPNKVRRVVRIREVIDSRKYKETKSKLPLVIGVDIHGEPVVEDLTQMPHLLIAGSTGSGKSVYVNSIITGLLYSKSPEELKFIMIDLKIVELKVYNGIPHLLFPVITTPNLAKAVLEWLVNEMQDRYRKLETLACRDIVQYNSKVSKLDDGGLEKLPYIVLIIDEYADLMMTSPKETEDYITRLAAMSRAVGIHLVIATQRPSVDVVTGLIKANFPARVAFRVASKVDSRTILDTIGAEKLLGKGDLLFMSPSHPNLIRVQGTFISNEEVERVVGYLLQQDSPNYIDISSFLEKSKETEEDYFEDEGEEFDDELYKEAIKIVVMDKKASASYLQRRLRIGYNRAARMIEKMEEEGIVGSQQGSKPREVLVDESYLDRFL
ncbi:MAG: DNA translocase FtsK [Brevinematia bacterium]